MTSEGTGSVTYTITYTGTPTTTREPESEKTPSVIPALKTENTGESSSPGFNWLWVACGALLLLALVFGIILIIVIRKRGAHEANYYGMEDTRYEEQN